MKNIFHLKGAFNLAAIGTSLETKGERIMEHACTRGSVGGACATGVVTLAATPLFGLSPIFAAVAFTTPVYFYGYGFVMKMLGKGLSRLASPT